MKLEVMKREGSAEVVRKSGRIPGIVYGPKQEPLEVSVDGLAFEKVLHEAGEATIISLEGLDQALEVLIHDVSFNAARGGAEHVDFYAIERGKELTVDVPLVFVGEAPAVKAGGTVTKTTQEIEITCRPADLPSHIDVDISVLINEESQIKVSDLVVPAGVTVETEGDIVVAMVSGARSESDADEVAAPDIASIAVEEKGKKEEAA